MPGHDKRLLGLLQHMGQLFYRGCYIRQVQATFRFVIRLQGFFFHQGGLHIQRYIHPHGPFAPVRSQINRFIQYIQDVFRPG